MWTQGEAAPAVPVYVRLRCESNEINCNDIILGGAMAGKIKADRIYVITIKSKLLQEFPYELVELFHPQHIKKELRPPPLPGPSARS